MQLKDATLLVVDDEPYYCEIAKDWFEREGCKVLTAENGVAALQLLEREKADAIITDIRMPGMDGVELVRRLKASGLLYSDRGGPHGFFRSVTTRGL